MSDLHWVHQLLAPRVAYLVGTRAPDGTPNMIPLSNVTPISTEPQQLAIAVYKAWQTHHNLLVTDGFTLSMPQIEQLLGVWKLGAKYSRYQYSSNIEKIIDSGLAVDNDASRRGPILADGIGWLEARIIRNLDFSGDHTLFVGQVEKVSFNPNYLNSAGMPRSDIHPVMQVGGNIFTTTAESRMIPYYS